MTLVSAGPTKATSSVSKDLESALKVYRAKGGVSVGIKKKTVSTLLSREKKSEGKLFYKKGKVRIEMQSPEASLLIMDGKHIWLETKLDEEFGGQIQVSKAKMGPIKKSNTLLAAIFDHQQLLKQFKLSKRKPQGKGVGLVFAPKDPDGGEIQALELWLNEEGRLSKIIYLDDRENETTLELGKPSPLDGGANGLFKYTPPKGAEVTEF